MSSSLSSRRLFVTPFLTILRRNLSSSSSVCAAPRVPRHPQPYPQQHTQFSSSSSSSSSRFTSDTPPTSTRTSTRSSCVPTPTSDYLSKLIARRAQLVKDYYNPNDTPNTAALSPHHLSDNRMPRRKLPYDRRVRAIDEEIREVREEKDANAANINIIINTNTNTNTNTSPRCCRTSRTTATDHTRL